MARIVVFLICIFVNHAIAFAQQSISIDEFEKKSKEAGLQILDVRTMGEYKSGFLKNALQADWNNKAQFDDRTQYLDKSKPVYVYCTSGGRSASAAAALRQKGYTALNLEGGLMAWKKAGKPVEGSSDQGKINQQEYQKYINQKNLVLVDFGASWCPPCKKMEPVIAELKKKTALTVQFVDGGVNTELMNEQKVEALPTFILYKNGHEVWRKQGIVSLEEFEALLKTHA